MNDKNYYEQMLDIIASLDKTTKPTLLLHSCCGPCNCYPMDFLKDYFDITIYFNNSNIFPKSEYDRRLEELINYLDYFNHKYNLNIKIIIEPFNELFYKNIEVLKDEKEGGARCHLCYRLRMSEAYQYALKNNFDYFTTVMTVSRQKDSKILNQIGIDIASNKDVSYFISDFKKNKGIEKGLSIAKDLKMYRQNYCGCQYSIYSKNNYKT